MTNATEKQFYLRSFRRRTFAIHLASEHVAADVAGPLADLRENETNVLLLAASAGRGALRLPPATRHLRPRDLATLSTRLIEDGSAALARGRALSDGSALAMACRLATALGLSKLVVVDPRGGIRGASVQPRSFLTSAQLVRLGRQAGDPRWSRAEISALLEAVRGGVESVNLTSAEALADELFTYEGAGTLLSANAYCRVRRLRLDDFSQASSLLEQGERDGFLLRRNAEQRVRLLMAGYGAWFEGGRLAGVASLERSAYRRQKMAEIAGLYTITRFHGEGVGVRLVRALARVAKQEGFRALFACTSNRRAAAFFRRNGFRPCAPERVPASKWRGRRGGMPQVFLLDLAGGVAR